MRYYQCSSFQISMNVHSTQLSAKMEPVKTWRAATAAFVTLGIVLMTQVVAVMTSMSVLLITFFVMVDRYIVEV